MIWLKLANRKLRISLGFVLCVLAALSLGYSEFSEKLSRKILDRQFSYLRSNHPNPVGVDVVIVGIDEASFNKFQEPFALWHPHLGRFFQAMSRAKPSVVGIDIALPQRSYDFLVKQYDQQITQGLLALRSRSPIVLGQVFDENGNFSSVYSLFFEASGTTALASVAVCAEKDGVSRRADPNQCMLYAQGETLSGSMAAHLGSSRMARGLIDFTVGDDFNYIPFHKVLEWGEQGDDEQLRQVFGGKPVLLGLIKLHEDRVNFPVALAAWEPENHQLPAVVWHAQALRSILTKGLLSESQASWVFVLTLLATLLWFARLHWLKFTVLLVFLGAVLACSTWLLGHSVYMPTGGILLAGGLAFILRAVYEFALKMREHQRLRGIFGNYVSSAALRSMLSGGVQSRLEGERKRVCILFANIHDFNERCETRTPQEIVAILNMYFTEMTIAIHQHNGTVGKFVDDAIMAYFGAPQTLDYPEKNALEAAQEMLLRLRQVNLKLKENGIAPIQIGVGVHIGEVVIGHVGSDNRHEYTAIGEVVSVAAQLEALTRTLGYPVLCSKEVALAVEFAGGLDELGEKTLRGGRVLSVCGWYPPLLASS